MDLGGQIWDSRRVIVSQRLPVGRELWISQSRDWIHGMDGLSSSNRINRQGCNYEGASMCDIGLAFDALGNAL